MGFTAGLRTAFPTAGGLPLVAGEPTIGSSKVVAERVGFEPTRPFRAYRFSRPA